jgi:hypothetical protein
MQALLGIPEDTPENTVKNIIAILEEGAASLGATFTMSESLRRGISSEITVDIALGSRQFRMMLSWVNSAELADATGSIGHGFMTSAWDLELLHGDPSTADMGWNPGESNPSPPFRWGLYPNGTGSGYLTSKPSHVLDGALLRKILRDSLEPEPPSQR